jgi:hypothetical protein
MEIMFQFGDRIVLGTKILCRLKQKNGELVYKNIVGTEHTRIIFEVRVSKTCSLPFVLPFWASDCYLLQVWNYCLQNYLTVGHNAAVVLLR